VVLLKLRLVDVYVIRSNVNGNRARGTYYVNVDAKILIAIKVSFEIVQVLELEALAMPSASSVERSC
jgi:hypothetical protein